MDACCALGHYPELEITLKEAQRDQRNRILEAKLAQEEDFGFGRIGQYREFLWNLTEYPERSLSARVIIQLYVLR